jgi:hypothetical protein
LGQSKTPKIQILGVRLEFQSKITAPVDCPPQKTLTQVYPALTGRIRGHHCCKSSSLSQSKTPKIQVWGVRLEFQSKITAPDDCPPQKTPTQVYPALTGRIRGRYGHTGLIGLVTCPLSRGDRFPSPSRPPGPKSKSSRAQRARKG